MSYYFLTIGGFNKIILIPATLCFPSHKTGLSPDRMTEASGFASVQSDS